MPTGVNGIEGNNESLYNGIFNLSSAPFLAQKLLFHNVNEEN
jgi:hypothetical protein